MHLLVERLGVVDGRLIDRRQDHARAKVVDVDPQRSQLEREYMREVAQLQSPLEQAFCLDRGDRI